MKLGLFGGTFNPVHCGHLYVAIEVQRRFCFDHIYFIPSRTPPHKNTEDLISASSRCHMILRSLPNDFPFSLSQVELSRGGPSYAIDTVAYFRSKLTLQGKLSFILGIDAFLELHTWKSYKNLVKWVELIVVSRSNEWSNTGINDLDVMNRYILKEVSSDYSFCIYTLCWNHKDMMPIYYLKIDSPDISSTLIRRNIKLGKDITCLVPSIVANYISGKGLYL